MSTTYTGDDCEYVAQVCRILEDLFGSKPRRRRKSTEIHYHKCDSAACGKIWNHCEADFKSSAQFEAGHRCPACGTEQLYKCTPEGKPI